MCGGSGGGGEGMVGGMVGREELGMVGGMVGEITGRGDGR